MVCRYAWAFEQTDGESGHKFGSQDVFVPYHARKAPAGKSATRPPTAAVAATNATATTAVSTTASTTASTATAATPTAAAAAEAATGATTSRGAGGDDAFEGGDDVVPSDGAADDRGGDSDDVAVLQRFCHVYKEGELERLVEMVPWLEVEQGWHDTGNWAVSVRRSEVAIPLEYETMFDQLADQLRE
jgi:hypothetical protein